MTFLIKLRFLVGLFCFGVLLFFVIWPTILVRDFWLSRRGLSDAERWRRNSRWVGRWAQRVRRWVLPIVRHRVRITLPQIPDGVTGPFILAGNHVSALDTVYCTLMADELGIPETRWLVKDEFRRLPAFGSLAQALGYLFISRSRADLDPITAFALRAAADRCSVGILPEGTRWKPGESDPEFTRVRRPKTGGFRAYCEQLPHYPVLSFTIRWPGGAGGRDLVNLDAFYDREVVIEVVYKGCVSADQAETFLLEDFREKNRHLTFVSL